VLDAYRILDLTDERGQMAGAMLAGLGAEVVLIEPPGGSPSRRVGPWLGRDRRSRRSLSHWVHNRGKRSVVLDLAGSGPDRAELRRLATGADVLIESAAPGDMTRLGLGYEELADLNPALVYVSISPFGRDGPKARWPATDLTVWASAMVLGLTGDADRAPVRISLPQAFLHAGADAAWGALLALYERGVSGLGQHIDVSAQASSLQATQGYVLAAPLRSVVPQRSAGGARLGTYDAQFIWKCRDGYVAVTVLFGAALGPFTRRLMAWIHEEGYCDLHTRDLDWVGFGARLLGQDPDAAADYERLKSIVASFTANKTKDELFEEAQKRRLLITPVSTIEDVARSDQLAARSYWDQVNDEEFAAETFRAPGPFAKRSGPPLPILGPPPSLGRDTTDVLAAVPRAPAHLPRTSDRPGGPPLAGTKVLDLMWVIAGPAITRVMADFGATVVRVESANRIDTARTLGPFLDGIVDVERSGAFYSMNAGKLSFSLDLAQPGSRDVFYELVRWADIVTESFSPGTMAAWGYDYERLREINPSVIMLSSSLMGQTGPLATFAGYGTLAAPVVGFSDITGWPDRPPAGPFSAYTDYVSPRFALTTLLAALDHRRRTGQGQYIDLAQTEASAHFLAPALIDYFIDGHVLQRCGNADTDMAPHGVYPALGDDAWVAIACRSDEEWQELCSIMGRSDLAAAASLCTLSGRLQRTTELDGYIAEWTAQRTADEASRYCRERGVPAHAVTSSEECATDPQLRARNHFVEVEHPTFGKVPVEGPRVVLSRTPGCAGPIPVLGQHTWEILRETFGYSDERIAGLFADQTLG
jgi:crotonobetainyl-CoA:carnitine CoA-transferase CaiB-like acyl-CoA transferase